MKNTKLKTMEEILESFKKLEYKDKYKDKVKFIEDVNKTSNKLVEIIGKYYENNNGLISFNNIFKNDVLSLNDKEVILLIQNIDDICSLLLLITSLLSNYTSQKNLKLNINDLNKYFLNMDTIFKEKIKEPRYNEEKILKTLEKSRNKMINNAYKQCKYVLKCYSLFILIPIVSASRFHDIYKKTKFRHDEYERASINLMDSLLTYLSTNNLVYKEYKKFKFKESIAYLRHILDTSKRTFSLFTKIFIDIGAIIYFLIYGMKYIDNRIEKRENNLRKRYESLKKTTESVLFALNGDKIIPSIVEHSKSLENFNFDEEYKNECNFSESSTNYIKFIDESIGIIVHEYAYLKKYLYNERDILNNIKKRK